MATVWWARLVLALTAIIFAACNGGHEKLNVTSTASVPVTQTRLASETPTPTVPTPVPGTSTPAPSPAPVLAISTPPIDEAPSPASIAPSATPEPTGASASPTPVSWLDGGKWHYTPSGSTCVYVESKRSKALYRDFTNADVILMDSENCSGTWYIYYPSTGEAHGAVSSPDDPRLRLRLIDGQVTILSGADGCAWTESRRQPDSQSAGGIIVALETTCDYDYGIWYFPETGELSFVIA
jgi:hypothetical protein